MCNFMGVRVSKIEFIKLLQLEKELGTVAAMRELEVMKDGFKYTNSVIIRKTTAGNDIEAVPAHWEFIPSWVQSMDDLKLIRKGINPKTGRKQPAIPWLNAKAENLLFNEKGSIAMWSTAAIHRRCLVLASHFFEWRHYQPEGVTKDIAYPYTIGLKGTDYFYMAGIWQPWTDRKTGRNV
jgi:putative SOS response-associated peptidase YedK